MVLVFLIILSFGQEGCTPTSTPTTNEENQEDIGRGIVIGTLGSQQSDLEPPLGTSKVIGQVLKIEGGAYILQNLHDAQERLPIDQNTSIDRPAHIGDWVEAYVDTSGRARKIRNVDHEIVEGSPDSEPL
jgi:hypothetical protein